MKLKRNREVLVRLFLIKEAFAAFTGVSFFPDNGIYEIDDSLTVTKILDTTDIGSVSISKDPVSKKMYVLTGTATDGQVLNEMCDNILLPIVPILPSSAVLYCLNAGPNGLFAVESGVFDGDLSFGKLDVMTGQWTKVSNINSPFGALVTGQDGDGIMHHINGEGQLFTNPGSNDQMRLDTKVKFPPDLANFCGDFDVDGTLVSTTDAAGGGMSRYNFKKQTAISTNFDTVNIFLNDITVGIGGSEACSSSAPSTVPTSTTEAPTKHNGKSSKKGSKKSSKKSKSSKKGSKSKGSKKSSKKISNYNNFFVNSTTDDLFIFDNRTNDDLFIFGNSTNADSEKPDWITEKPEEVTSCIPEQDEGCCSTMIPPSKRAPDESTCWQWYKPQPDGSQEASPVTKGCDYKPCEEAVCACDDYCCTIAWDLSCRGYDSAKGDNADSNYFMDGCSARLLCCEQDTAFPKYL